MPRGAARQVGSGGNLQDLAREFPPHGAFRQWGGGGLAFVVMQFASEPWNLFRIIASELGVLGYHALRADRVPGVRDPDHIWTLLKAAHLVLVDVTHLNVNVFMELGAAAAYRDVAEEAGLEAHRIAVIADEQSQTTTVPFDLTAFRPARYRLVPQGDAEISIRQAVRRAVGDAEFSGISTHLPHEVHYREDDWFDSRGEGQRVLDALPAAVTAVLPDPSVALLATSYVQLLGRHHGEELAASTRFRDIRDWWVAPVESGGLPIVHELALGEKLITDAQLRGTALEAIARMLKIVLDRDRRATTGADVARLGGVDKRLLFVQALLTPDSQRTSGEVEVLSTTLSDVLACTTKDAWDRPGWKAGLHAIEELTRLRAVSVTPAELKTIDRLRQSAGEFPGPRLRTIATLGGAYYFGFSAAILAEHGSPYASPARTIATEAPPGQRIEIPADANDVGLGEFKAGLSRLAHDDPPLTFSVEHPFHFRVLLEVLSGENRRYPAECVVTHEALSLLLGREPRGPVVWYRGELPFVGNILAPAQGGAVATAYVQDYPAFGRTPFTSSFMKLDYRLETDLRRHDWWPRDLSAVPTSVLNMPRSVAEVESAVLQQRRWQRLLSEPLRSEDAPYLAGEVIAWDGASCRPEAIAAVLFRPAAWGSLSFLPLVIAGLQSGCWLLEALSNWHKVEAALHDDTACARADQLSAVLTVMKLFVEREIVPSTQRLQTSLHAVRNGSDSSQVDELLDRLRSLNDTLHRLSG